VPGVIAVIIAYINEEFPGRVGTVMAAYVSGTVFGGFIGRVLSGLLATHMSWRATFLILGILNLIGAFAVRQWLPLAVNFVPAKHVFRSLGDTWGHLQNPRLLAVCGMGFTILFSLVGTFSYASFQLARPPFNLTPAALGGIFFVYLLGCIITPLAGRFLDRHGFRRTAWLSVSATLTGLALMLAPSLRLVIAGLALFSSGIFVSQSAATVLAGRVAGHARSAAAGLYVTFYYAGGSLGTMVAAWFWVKDGWPACVGLFATVSLGTLGFALLGGRSVANDGAAAGPIIDTAI
jgi:MFS family permease